jgi:hypothetical protein
MLKRWQAFIMTILLAACASAGPLASQRAGGEANGSAGTSEPVGISDDSIDSVDAPQALVVNLEDLGPAPELVNEVWLNTDQPLRLEGLRGNVVLLDMWTFG